MYRKCMNRETERMFHEDCMTRQNLRRNKEQMIRQKEIMNRSIEDHRRKKEEDRVVKEKHMYHVYQLYKQGDNHKHLLYYTDPYSIDLELIQRIEEEDRVMKEDSRREKENIRWNMEDKMMREEDRDSRSRRKRFAFQELCFHLRLLEILQMTHDDPRIQHALISYHKEAVLHEMNFIHFYRKLI